MISSGKLDDGRRSVDIAVVFEAGADAGTRGAGLTAMRDQIKAPVVG
jgi:hypothetical protein